ncbi:MAG: hypothetical protein N2035_09030 [Chthoniobacterales bacterium]|nr:hypothetical protein [Chthoniobacterales bacterium]MCX7713784.1 hypothetical protein [Chthoniobacterales bacterium]
MKFPSPICLRFCGFGNLSNPAETWGMVGSGGFAGFARDVRFDRLDRLVRLAINARLHPELAGLAAATGPEKN